MLSVKKHCLDVSLRVLSLILKRQQRNKPGHLVTDLNMKDEGRNGLFHHLFQNFSSNMELSVEMC